MSCWHYFLQRFVLVMELFISLPSSAEEMTWWHEKCIEHNSISLQCGIGKLWRALHATRNGNMLQDLYVSMLWTYKIQLKVEVLMLPPELYFCFHFAFRLVRMRNITNLTLMQFVNKISSVWAFALFIGFMRRFLENRDPQLPLSSLITSMLFFFLSPIRTQGHKLWAVSPSCQQFEVSFKAMAVIASTI